MESVYFCCSSCVNVITNLIRSSYRKNRFSTKTGRIATHSNSGDDSIGAIPTSVSVPELTTTLISVGPPHAGFHRALLKPGDVGKLSIVLATAVAQR